MQLRTFTGHIVSAGVGNCQHSFQGSIVRLDEHSSTKRDVHPGSNAFLMASCGPIFHCLRAQTRNSSHVPHSCAARLSAFLGASRLHELRSSSVCVSGRFLAAGHGRVRRDLHAFPWPHGVHCVGGCSTLMARDSILTTSCWFPLCTARKDRWKGA